MQRALDFVPFEEAIAQPCIPMRAQVVRGKKVTVDTVDGHIYAIDNYSNNVIDRHVLGSNRVLPWDLDAHGQMG
jgi:hypothetical protein